MVITYLISCLVANYEVVMWPVTSGQFLHTNNSRVASVYSS